MSLEQLPSECEDRVNDRRPAIAKAAHRRSFSGLAKWIVWHVFSARRQSDGARPAGRSRGVGGHRRTAASADARILHPNAHSPDRSTDA